MDPIWIIPIITFIVIVLVFFCCIFCKRKKNKSNKNDIEITEINRMCNLKAINSDDNFVYNLTNIQKVNNNISLSKIQNTLPDAHRSNRCEDSILNCIAKKSESNKSVRKLNNSLNKMNESNIRIESILETQVVTFLNKNINNIAKASLFKKNNDIQLK